jgi:hypothetical protein
MQISRRASHTALVMISLRDDVRKMAFVCESFAVRSCTHEMIVTDQTSVERNRSGIVGLPALIPRSWHRVIRNCHLSHWRSGSGRWAYLKL